MTSHPVHTRPPRVLLSGGGTGGHVYPAIAIADAIRRRRPDAVVAFAGSPERIEWREVPRAGYPIHAVHAQGFQRRLTARNFKMPITLAQGIVDSWKLVEAFDADVAVGTGGYVAGPVMWAAHRRRRPILIQEQNAIPGVTNKIVSRYADRIHAAFPETLDVFPRSRTSISGNPTRSELTKVDPGAARAYFDLSDDARVLLILGGSGGSKPLNQVIERLLPEFLSDGRTVVVWQTGRRFHDEVSSRIETHERIRLVPFVDRMDYAYCVASMSICRSGALTCSELLATGTASILIPSPHVAADHQTMNAQGMVTMGAARMVPEHEVRKDLYRVWNEIWTDQERLSSMSSNAREHATPDAADVIAADVMHLASTRQR